MSHLLELGGPGLGRFDRDDDGGQFRRVLVPIDSYERARNALRLAVRMGRTAAAWLRLVHVRTWGPVGPRGAGRFYCETSEEAIVALTEGAATDLLLDARARLLDALSDSDPVREASGVVVDAERSRTAAAILAEATAWGADVILLTRRTPRFANFSFWDRVSRQVTRGASCPVLVVYQGQA